VSPSRRSARADSLRAHQLAVRFGAAARHPLCQAALALWSQDEQRAKALEDAVSLKMLLNKAEQQKQQAKASLDESYKEEKQKEAIEEAALWNKINEISVELREACQAQTVVLAFLEEMRIYATAQFDHELLAAKLTKNTSALKALSRVKKRWKALSTGARLKHGEQREIGTLQLLQDKKIKAAWAKGGALAGYTEAMDGGDRPLSDDEWQRRLTAREIHSHLEATVGSRVAGDKDAKEIRRVTKRLGLRLAEDQVGRKWKEPHPVTAKQEPKKRRGRPPSPNTNIKPLYVENPAAVEGVNVKAPRVVKMDSWIKTGKLTAGIKGVGTEKAIAGIDYLSCKEARKEIAAIQREIDKLTLIRGGRLGKFVY